MNKSIIALAVAGVLASGAVNAADGDMNSTDNTTPVFSVATLSLDAVVRDVAGAQPIILIPENSALPILATGDKLSLELTGGATFDTASLALELAHVDFVYDDSIDAGVLDDNTVSIDASSCTLSMGDAKVVCDLTVADTSNTSASFTLENTKYNLSAVPSTETEVSLIAKVISTDVFGNVVEKYSPPTGGASDVFTVSAGIVKAGALTADNTATAQVSESFFKFASAAVTTPNAGSAAKIATFSADVTLDGADFGDATGKYLIILSNLPTGTKKVTIDENSGTAPAIAASNATGGSETATESGTFFLDGSGNGYAVSTLDANLDYDNLIIEVTGTDPVSVGDAKIEIKYLAGAGDVFADHVILEEATFVTIDRNGSSFTTNNVGPALKIKVTDMSGTLVSGTGGISLIAYDAAGTMISGTMAIPDLESNSTVKIKGVDLEAAYPGIKRADFSVASSKIVAAGQKINADGGINVNTYSSAGGGAL